MLSITDKDGNAITNANNIGVLNPIRYRGYYYDAETGFYYLQARYYDPAMHRFINADSSPSTGQSFAGTNMFVYCLNNPVVRIDETGEVSIWALLFETFQYGFVHWTVEKHIAKKYGMGDEAWLKDGEILAGRADIYDSSTRQVWEIKHGYDKVGIAQAQALGYVGKKVIRDGTVLEKLGPAHAFSGSFPINVLGNSYKVEYSTPKEGAIIYVITELEPQKEYEFALSRDPVNSTVTRRESVYSYGYGYSYGNASASGLTASGAITLGICLLVSCAAGKLFAMQR